MSDLWPVVSITAAVVVLVVVASWLGARKSGPSSMFGIRKPTQPR